MTKTGEIVRHIVNNVYLMEVEGRLLVVKQEASIKDSDGILRRLVWLLFNGSLSFKHEKRIYEQLGKYKFKYINTFPIYDTSEPRIIVFEYIEGSRGWDSNVIATEHVVQCIDELQKANVYVKGPLIQRISVNMLNKVVLRILRNSLYIAWRLNYLGLLPRVTKCILRCISGQRKLKNGRLVHGDIRNMYTSRDEQLYMYDFETVVREKRWFMLDLVELSFDCSDLTLDMNLIDEYVKNVVSNDSGKPNMQAQIRIGVLNRCLHALVNHDNSRKHQSVLLDFVNETVLQDDEFCRWLTNHELHKPVCRKESN